MSKPRTAAVAALALCVLGTGLAASADAARKPKTRAIPPVCDLVTDATGDTFLLRTQDSVGKYGPQEDALDITSMDIASDAKRLTAVVRVKKLSTKVATAPLGTDYRLQFVLPGEAAGENIVMNARTDPSGTPSFIVVARTLIPNGQGQSTTAKIADITGVFDLAKNEIRMTVPLSVLSPKGAVSPGSKIALNTLGGLDQTSARATVVNPVTGVGTATFADVALSDRVYTAGAPSCVVVGK